MLTGNTRHIQEIRAYPWTDYCNLPPPWLYTLVLREFHGITLRLSQDSCSRVIRRLLLDTSFIYHPLPYLTFASPLQVSRPILCKSYKTTEHLDYGRWEKPRLVQKASRQVWPLRANWFVLHFLF